MGKVTMPKNTAKLHEIHAALEIYYNADGWLNGNDYITLMQAKIGADKGLDEYPKKENILSYFGFTEREYIDRRNKRKRITSLGKAMHEAIKNEDAQAKYATIMKSLETVTFGRNNHGSLTSDTNIEPPCLFVRAAMELGYLTYKEFAFLLWRMEEGDVDYDMALTELKKRRTESAFDLDDAAKNYTDAKPIMLLIRWGFLAENGTEQGSKKIAICPEALALFEVQLRSLLVYNTNKKLNATIAFSKGGIQRAKKEISKDTKEEAEEDASFLIIVNSEPEPTVTAADVSYAPRDVVKKVTDRAGTVYVRDPKVSRIALKLAEHKCELCNEPLRLFVRKSNGTNYTEPHHLIPMACQEEIPDSKSLDHIANIISLCSYCHNFLHYGRIEDKQNYIERLYNSRKDKLTKAQICIELNALLEIYK